MFSFFGDDCHVRRTGSDIFSRYVITAQPFNKSAVSAKNLFTVNLARVRDDHRFAAAHIQPRQLNFYMSYHAKVATRLSTPHRQWHTAKPQFHRQQRRGRCYVWL